MATLTIEGGNKALQAIHDLIVWDRDSIEALLRDSYGLSQANAECAVDSVRVGNITNGKKGA